MFYFENAGGEKPSKIFHGFSLFPKIFHFALFKWKLKVLAAIFCDRDNEKKVLLAVRKLQALNRAEELFGTFPFMREKVVISSSHRP